MTLRDSQFLERMLRAGAKCDGDENGIRINIFGIYYSGETLSEAVFLIKDSFANSWLYQEKSGTKTHTENQNA